MIQTEKQHLPKVQNSIRWLYQKYSPLLLGYISGSISDPRKSEKFLVQILSRFAIDYQQEIITDQVNWLQLLQYTRNALSEQNRPQSALITNHQYKEFNYSKLQSLSDREKEIFCAIYYHGKSIGELAMSMEENEHSIRSQFKLSLDKIRSTREN